MKREKDNYITWVVPTFQDMVLFGLVRGRSRLQHGYSTSQKPEIGRVRAGLYF